MLGIPYRKTDTAELKRRRQQHAVTVAHLMEDAFSEDDLRALTFDLGIDYESIVGEGKRGKIRALVSHFYRRNTLDVFVGLLAAERPNIAWGDGGKF